MSSWLVNSSALNVSVRPENIWPALLMITSGAPDSVRILSAAELTEAVDVTSSSSTRRSSPSAAAIALISPATLAFFPVVPRIVAYTRTPFRASRSDT